MARPSAVAEWQKTRFAVGAAYSLAKRLASELISAPQRRSVGSSFSSPAVTAAQSPDAKAAARAFLVGSGSSVFRPARLGLNRLVPTVQITVVAGFMCLILQGCDWCVEEVGFIPLIVHLAVSGRFSLTLRTKNDRQRETMTGCSGNLRCWSELTKHALIHVPFRGPARPSSLSWDRSTRIAGVEDHHL